MSVHWETYDLQSKRHLNLALTLGFMALLFLCFAVPKWMRFWQ